MNTRTNPAYAHLAYRKAVLGRVVQFLSDEFLARTSDEPKDVVLCEDVFRDDSEVPMGNIEEYIEELQQEEESLRLELSRFEFVKRGDDGAVSGKEKGSGKQAGSKKGGQASQKSSRGGKRSGRRPPSS